MSSATAPVAKTYRWNASVRSYILAACQGKDRKLPAKKFQSELIDRQAGAYRCTVTATPAGHELISAAVRELMAGDVEGIVPGVDIPASIDRG